MVGTERRVIIAAVFFLAQMPSWALAARLSDGIPIRVRVLHVISSETSTTGDRVEFAVMRDIVSDGQVLIRRGTVATGTVVEATRARLGFITRQGRLAFRFDQTFARDGQTIRLRASPKPDTSRPVRVDRGHWRHLLKWAAEADTFNAFVDGEYDVQPVQPRH